MVHSDRKGKPRKSVAVPFGSYVLLTMGAGTLILALSTITSLPELAYPVVLVPAIVAYLLALARKVDVRAIAGSAPSPFIFLVCLVFGPALVAGVLAATGSPVEFQVPTPVILYWAIAGAVAGELGWRGYLQPLLAPRLPPIAAGLVTGVVWSAWQIPLAVSGAAQFPGTQPIDVLAWGLGSAMALTALIEIRPRSTWYAIALQVGFTVSFAMTLILPGEAGSTTPFSLVSAVTTVIGLLLLAAFRWKSRRGRHQARTHNAKRKTQNAKRENV